MWNKLPEKVKLKITRDSRGGCWESTNKPSPAGYTRLRVAGIQEVSGHRTIYTLLKGAIPKGMHLDHLCKNRICVNPEHLEPVTREENSRRVNPGYVHWSYVEPVAIKEPAEPIEEVELYQLLVEGTLGMIESPHLKEATPFNSQWVSPDSKKEEA